MKKATINRLLASALTVFALTACTNETHENGFDNRTPLTVTSSSIAASRATDNAWQAADAIGVTLFESGTSTTVEGNPLAGKYVTSAGDGAFTAVDKANTLYFPTQNKKADIVAFYPYTTIDASLLVPVSVADQSKLSAIDLMVADKVSGKSATDDKVALTFRHQLVKLDFTIDKVDVSEDVDLSKAVVTIDGTPTKAVWNLMDETLAVDDADKATLTLPAVYHAADDVLSGTAILIPTAVKGVTIYIKVGEHTFEVPFTDAMKLQAGTHNTLRIHLKQTRATVEASVTDWTTGVTVDLNNLQIVVSGTATDLTDNSAFTSMKLWLANERIADYSSATTGASLGTPHTYTKGDDGAWTSTSPIYLDELTANSVIYATATNTTAKDAVTGFSDNLLAGPVTVQGGAAAIEFRHGLAQMTVKLVTGTDFATDITGATITTPAMLKSVAMVTTTNEDLHFVARGTETVNYSITDADAHLVVPQTLAKDAVFIVTLANGNTYEAKLAEAVTLEAGKNTTVNLTLLPTTTSVKVAVTPWGETAEASAVLKLAGLTDGSVSYTATAGDVLEVYYNSTIASADGNFTMGSYTYSTDGTWTATTPLYWDEIAQTGFTSKFIARLTPATATSPEQNMLTGIATGVAYGGEASFTLKHSTAKLSFTIQAGTGIANIDTEVPTRTLTLGKSSSCGLNNDGIIDYGTLTDTDINIGTADLHVAPQTLTDAHVVTLTRGNGNKYTIKLSELKDAADAAIFGTNGIEAGKHYTITLTVNETSVGITATIAAWTNVNGSGEMKPEF